MHSKLRPHELRYAAALTALSLASTTLGQNATPATANENPVTLSVFEVTGQAPNRYQAAEATSGGRVRTALFDSPQTINVVTGELLKDVGATRLLDGLKYVPGVTESTIPNALDRLTVRGFQIDGRTVDGFSDPAVIISNLEPASVDHIEVVMGPNSILSPTGSPGGTVNVVSKKPSFNAATTLSLENGLFDAGGIILDSTGPLGGGNAKLAYRLVASVRDYDGYFDGTETSSYLVAPAVTYQIAPESKLTVQAEIKRWRTTNYLGLPIDPSAGTNNTARLLSGISPKLGIYEDDDAYRLEKSQEFRTFFTTKVTESLSTRVAARLAYIDGHFTQLNTNGAAGGNVDPLTGFYVPGFSFGPAPTFTPTPIALPGRTFTRAGTETRIKEYRINLQNDWVYKRSFEGVESTTSAGIAYFTRRPDGDYQVQDNAITGTPFNIDTPPFPTGVTTGAVTARLAQIDRNTQLYVNQSLGFLHEKVIVSAGASSLDVENSGTNILPATPVRLRGVDSTESTFSYGVVVKPVPTLSLYYGHSENAQPIDVRSLSFAAATDPDFTLGEQDEFGARVRLLDNKLQAGVTYYEILQTNFGIPNPARLVPGFDPATTPTQIFSDRKAKGWEFQATYEVTRALTLIGNYTTFTNRSPLDVPFRGTAEKSGAVWARYAFREGPAKGLVLGLGSNYLAKRPGTAASGQTAASTPANIIPNQPQFYLPARTLVDASIAYDYEAWNFQLNIDNVLDEDYLAAGINRFLVFPGTGTNFRASVTYRF